MGDVRLRLIKSIAAAKAEENDIVLVLDSSGSIGDADWQKMLQACETLLTTMSSKPIRVAVVVFDTTASIICPWTNDYVSVMATLYAHVRSRGTTNTLDGLQKARELFITGSAANRSRLVFLFTDGLANNHPGSAAMALRECPAKIFSVGIGSGVSLTELSKVSFEEHCFMFESFDELREVFSNLVGDDDNPFAMHDYSVEVDVQMRSDTPFSFQGVFPLLVTLTNNGKLPIPAGTRVALSAPDFFTRCMVGLSEALEPDTSKSLRIDLKVVAGATLKDLPESVAFQISHPTQRITIRCAASSIALGTELVGHAIVRTPPPEDTVPEFNIILFGLAGCGKSSFLCSALSALCSSLQMNVTTIGGQSDHVTDRYFRYRLSTYCPGARVNLWDVWGLDVDNFNNDSFKRFLTGDVPDNYNMVEALNMNILDMPDIRASTPAEREIHAVLMFMPLGYLELPEELQAQFRRNVEIAMRQGRNAILVVTRMDTLGTTAEREAYRSRLAEHFKIPSSRIHMIKNYTTEERKTFAIDKPILQLLESAIDFAGQFLAQRRRRIGHAIPAVPMGVTGAGAGLQTLPDQSPKTQPAIAQPATINEANQQPVGQVSAVPAAAAAPAGDAAMAPAKPEGPPVAICVWNGHAYFKCRLTAKSTFGAVRTQAVRFLKLPGHADDWFLQDEEQQILMDNELVQETFAGAGAGSIDVDICSNA